MKRVARHVFAMLKRLPHRPSLSCMVSDKAIWCKKVCDGEGLIGSPQFQPSAVRLAHRAVPPTWPTISELKA